MREFSVLLPHFVQNFRKTWPRLKVGAFVIRIVLRACEEFEWSDAILCMR